MTLDIIHEALCLNMFYIYVLKMAHLTITIPFHLLFMVLLEDKMLYLKIRWPFFLVIE